jgi:tetratricopeptide (TPR) repeat protein
VAEETEQDTGAEASGAGVDPAAVALALGGASREDAGAFLKKQAALIDDQRHHLREQFKQLRLSIWQQRLGVLLRVATGFVGIAVAAVFAFMIWSASQSSDLLIEPFSVPPDLAQRGMTGEVVAAELLDHLSEMQTQAVSLRPLRSITSESDQAGFKLEIPETGVSLTELDDFLRAKLGHDTHFTGEIVRTEPGLSLTARAGGNAAASVSGPESDLNRLIQQLSENVYQVTDPFRYGVYLAEHDRLAEAISIEKAIAQTGATPQDRAFGYVIWGVVSAEEEGIESGKRILQQALKDVPDNSIAIAWLGGFEQNLGQREQGIRDYKKALSLATTDPLALYSASARTALRGDYAALSDMNFGDFFGAASPLKEFVQFGSTASVSQSALLAQADASDHNLADARATLLETSSFEIDAFAGLTALNSLQAKMLIDSEAQDWAGVLSEADAFAPMLQKYPGLPSHLPTVTIPLTAYAEAKLGKIADAEKHIAATPADCYDCLIARARIAEVEGQHGRADYWFARAIDGQKSIPFAYADWGHALLERGDADAAIAKFTLANQKGPHFADPLEMWGEALMKKNRSDLALAKFTEAEKYAPNWGRLHLKWGEALGFARRNAEAQKQFTQAAGLDLSSADRAELAKVSHG